MSSSKGYGKNDYFSPHSQHFEQRSHLSQVDAALQPHFGQVQPVL
ncbi:hypothetical protein [Psychrobacter cryohalolentis]|nr:hypothetical protein [Psychrobacter cryohalolentis]